MSPSSHAGLQHHAQRGLIKSRPEANLRLYSDAWARFLVANVGQWEVNSKAPRRQIGPMIRGSCEIRAVGFECDCHTARGRNSRFVYEQPLRNDGRGQSGLNRRLI